MQQVYKCFPASDSACWISLQPGFVCSWFLPVASLSPPWHGRGDLIVVWLPWHSKRGMREGNYCTSPVLSREQTGNLMTFAVSGVTGSHCPFPVRWLSHSQPSPFVFTRNKAQKTTKPDAPCSLTSFRLGENKGRATFFTVKMSNSPDHTLMWKSHNSTRTVQFCDKEGLESCRKGGKFFKFFFYSL